jgi:hypothetical protein
MNFMSKQKRPRGRPRGSGKDDSRHLALVADLLVRKSGLSDTAAMKDVMNSSDDWDAASDDALIRRWQAKWKIHRISLMAAAHERASWASASLPELLALLDTPQDWPIVKAICELQASWRRLTALRL